jgi:hypothetical protein
MEIQGYWLDGKTSVNQEAALFLDGAGRVRVDRLDTGQQVASASGKDLKVSPRLGDTPRFIRFSNGGKFETKDNRGVDDLLAGLGRRSVLGLVHKLESRWRYVLISLVVFGLACWAAVQYGLPFGAKYVAYALPDSVYTYADGHVMELFDRTLLSKSELPKYKQDRLQRYFAPVLKDHPGLDLKVLFRHGGKVGPNAFALPGGTLVFTDEMVRLARHYDELVAVLAHEIGHVKERHAMRRMVQSSPDIS